MGVDFIYPEFEVVRNDDRCIACRVCERQCANEVHWYSGERARMMSDEAKCVNCQRCVSLCPTRALKIVRSPCRLRENANWQNDTIREIYKQAGSGGVLLSSMGNPRELPVYWDRILINASQVTNPPIDPLREPMETRVFLGAKPDKILRDGSGNLLRALAADRTVHAGHVLRDELRLHQLQRPRVAGPGGYGDGRVLQHRRGRTARGFLCLRREYGRAGRERKIRRTRTVPRGGRGH